MSNKYRVIIVDIDTGKTRYEKEARAICGAFTDGENTSILATAYCSPEDTANTIYGAMEAVRELYNIDPLTLRKLVKKIAKIDKKENKRKGARK